MANLAATGVLLAAVVAVPSAAAADPPRQHTARCSQGSTAALSTRHNPLRLRLFVNSDRAGQQWSFRLVEQPDDRLALGRRTTNGAGNFWAVVRHPDDDDRFTAVARNLRTGEKCQVTLPAIA